MKIIVILSLSLLLISCKSSPNRSTSSIPTDLTGTYLGVEQRPAVKLNSDQRASRIYLTPVPGEQGSYYSVLLQYPRMETTGARYAMSKNWRTGKTRKGFLTKILERVWVHKAIPIPGTREFNLYRLKVEGDAILPIEAASKRLVLSRYATNEDPLGGAKIIQVDPDRDKGHAVYFPKQGPEQYKYAQELQYGQFQIANFVYGKGGIKRELNSTWHTDYIAGRYLAAYYARYQCNGKLTKDFVLDLTTDNEKNSARLYLNPCQAKVSSKKRKTQFTDSRSAFLTGDLTVTEPIEGMFLFKPKNSTTPKYTGELLQPRIGLFIDVFDATETTGEDVVELVLVDPEQPQKFLMYFEDPDNMKSKH